MTDGPASAPRGAAPSSLLGRAALAVLVGGSFVALRLWPMGASARLGSAVVMATCGAVAVVGVLDLMSVRSRAAVIAVGTALATAATVPSVGRAPVPLAVAATVIALVALASRPPRLVAVAVLLLHGTAWCVLGSNAVAAVLLAAALALALLRRDRSPRALLESDRALLSLAHRGAAAGAALARWGARVLLVLVGWARRHLAAAARWGVRLLRSPATWVGLAAGLVTVPMFWRIGVDPKATIRGVNDINSGLPRIDYIRFWPFRMSAAHPIWLVTIKLLDVGLRPAVSTTLVSAASVAAAVTVLVHVGRSRWDSLHRLSWPVATGFGLGYLLLESPALFVPRSSGLWGRFEFAGQFAKGTSYASIHLWGTPTVVMSLPFAFATFWLVLQLLETVEDRSDAARGRRRRLAALTVFLTLLQPATTLALVPASIAYLVVRRRAGTWSLRALATAYAVPGTLVVLGQVAFLSTDVSPYEQATWLWRPFWVWHYFGMDRPAYYLIFVFFAACGWAGGRRYWADPGVALGWLALGIALVPFLLLEQTTIADVPDGDLGVPPLMALVFLFLASLRFALIALEQRWRARVVEPRPAPWVPVLVLVLAVMFVAGAVDLAAALGAIPET